MKKLLSVLLCISLFLVNVVTGYCVDISASFEDSSISPLKIGSGLVELTEDPEDSTNTVSKITGSAESDSYLTTAAQDYSSLTYIDLKFYRAPGSFMRFYFRDNISTSNNITIVSIGSKDISLGGELFKISDNTWYKLRITLDKPNDKLAFYLITAENSDSSTAVTAERKLSDYSTYAAHNFSYSALRFSISKTTDENVIFYLDDINVKNSTSNKSLDNLLYMTHAIEKNYTDYWHTVGKVSDGEYRVVTNLENYENTAKQITIANVLYNKNGLMKSYTPNVISLPSAAISRIYTPFSLSGLEDGDYLKTFIFDSQENISPISRDFSYEKMALNYNSKPEFNQTMIDKAIDSAVALEYTSSGGNTGNIHSASALYYMLLLEHMYPGIKSSNENTARDKALLMIRHLTAGGNEPYACVGCYCSHPIVAAARVMAKNTPTVWNEFTEDEKDRIDWLMRALSIAGNWGFNDKNNYLTGFDLKGNFNKNWNPNYRNTYLNVVIAGAQYFGADELDEIFVNFNYDTYIAKLTELGYTNILSTWTVAGKGLMENGGSCVLVAGLDSRYEAGDDGGSGAGVKIPFTYQGFTLHELESIFENLMRYTYSQTVVSSVAVTDDYTAGIATGATSPYEGLYGMMREFNSGDGGGKRSSAGYCIDSFVALIPTYANLKLLSNWKSEYDTQLEVDNLIFIGCEDLIFKCEEGYNDYSLGTARGTTQYAPTGSRHYHYTKDIWRAFHMTFENPYV